MSSIVITGIVAALATAGVIIRPLGLPQAVWAVAGAALLIPLHLLSPGDALAGVSRGVDVYLFLAGMMLLSEIAREEGLFAWLAAIATRRSRGSATRLFLLIYAVGVIVTTFLSNDATAVVLTPAVAAAARSAKAEQPLPYLLICAFIANAASFVLPISNPANLVIYGAHVPPLLQWLPRYLLPSGLSIAATYAVLRWTQRGALKQKVDTEITVPILSLAGKTAALGLAVTAIALLAASALDVRLGLPTAVAGALTALVVLIRERKSPWQAIKGVSWGVLPLVAGLFVLVEALEKAGLIRVLSTLLQAQAARSAACLAPGVGIFVACVSNLINNLPMGLIAGSAVHGAHVSDLITRAVLIGVDLGPNLSVTGSLATILWFTALRREGLHVSSTAFLRLGLLVMPPALLLAIGAALLTR
ncbi:MAG: arsenic transporter [Steroidobacteraceae bacterium]